MSGFTSDPHSEKGSECPRNFFGLTDYRLLQAVERSFCIRRAAQLEDRAVTGSFDSAHLRAIHKYIFQDIFPWAGEFRVVNIRKSETPFGPAMYLAAAVADALAKLKSEKFLVGLSAHDFATRAAFYLGEINAIHPFREGNGRTQREFIRQLAVHAGHPLSWAGFTQPQMVEASIRSHTTGDNSALAAIIEAALYSSRENAPGK